MERVEDPGRERAAALAAGEQSIKRERVHLPMFREEEVLQVVNNPPLQALDRPRRKGGDGVASTALDSCFVECTPFLFAAKGIHVASEFGGELSAYRRGAVFKRRWQLILPPPVHSCEKILLDLFLRGVWCYRSGFPEELCAVGDEAG